MKHSTRTFGIIGLVIVVVVVAIIALSKGGSSDTMHMGDSSSATNTSTMAVSTNAVTIKSYAFSPAVIKVKVGTKVTWTNQDAVGHTITADTKSADAPDSQLFAKGESYSFTFNKAGTYTYFCVPHPYMKGTVEVVN